MFEVEGEAAVAAKARGWIITEAVCAAANDPDSPFALCCPEVARAGQILRDLYDFQYDLIWTHHIDGNLVNFEMCDVLENMYHPLAYEF